MTISSIRLTQTPRYLVPGQAVRPTLKKLNFYFKDFTFQGRLKFKFDLYSYDDNVFSFLSGLFKIGLLPARHFSYLTSGLFTSNLLKLGLLATEIGY